MFSNSKTYLVNSPSYLIQTNQTTQTNQTSKLSETKSTQLSFNDEHYRTRRLQSYVNSIKEFSKIAPPLPIKRFPIKNLTIWKDQECGISYINILGQRVNEYITDDIYEKLVKIKCTIDEPRCVLNGINRNKCYISIRDSTINWINTKIICLVLQDQTHPALIYDIPYEQLHDNLEIILNL